MKTKLNLVGYNSNGRQKPKTPLQRQQHLWEFEDGLTGTSWKNKPYRLKYQQVVSPALKSWLPQSERTDRRALVRPFSPSFFSFPGKYGEEIAIKKLTKGQKSKIQKHRDYPGNITIRIQQMAFCAMRTRERE